MIPTRVAGGADSRGFTLIELMVVVVIISLATAIAVPLYADAMTRSKRSAFMADTMKLYNALMAYNADFGAFPSEDLFDLATLEPLSNQGYFNSPSSYTSKLVGGELMFYIAPDVGGTDQHVVAVAQFEMAPEMFAAVAYTNIVSDDGEWVDGVYIIDEDDIEDAELD